MIIAHSESVGTGGFNGQTSVPLLLDVLVSPPPDTAAVLTTLPTAAGTGRTVNRMSSELRPTPTELPVLQVTNCPTAEQDHSAPVADTKINPAGSVSVTVIVPLLAAVPTFCTVMI